MRKNIEEACVKVTSDKSKVRRSEAISKESLAKFSKSYFLASLIIVNSDALRFRKLKANLQNNYLRGNDQCLELAAKALKLLSNFVGLKS